MRKIFESIKTEQKIYKRVLLKLHINDGNKRSKIIHKNNNKTEISKKKFKFNQKTHSFYNKKKIMKNLFNNIILNMSNNKKL